MKPMLGAALLAALMIAPLGARAQSLGPFTGAEILPMNGRTAGFYVQGSSSTTALLSQLRLSFYPGVDFGFQGGLSRIEFASGDRTLVQVGADVRFGLARIAAGSPLDVAIGGGFGIDAGDDYSLLGIGPTIHASRALALGSGSTLTPYAAAGIAYTMASIGADSRNDVYVPFNIGTEFRPNAALSLAAELQFRVGNRFRDDVGLAIGANFPF